MCLAHFPSDLNARRQTSAVVVVTVSLRSWTYTARSVENTHEARDCTRAIGRATTKRAHENSETLHVAPHFPLGEFARWRCADHASCGPEERDTQ